MSVVGWIITWAAGFGAFLALDMLWLGFVARGLYRSQYGSLLADQPNWPVAFAFYVVFVAGVLYFAVQPALGGDWTDALVRGAIFGFVAYATYDLTSLAVISGFPAKIAVVDMAWGAILSSAVATAAWTVATRLP